MANDHHGVNPEHSFHRGTQISLDRPKLYTDSAVDGVVAAKLDGTCLVAAKLMDVGASRTSTVKLDNEGNGFLYCGQALLPLPAGGPTKSDTAMALCERLTARKEACARHEAKCERRPPRESAFGVWGADPVVDGSVWDPAPVKDDSDDDADSRPPGDGLDAFKTPHSSVYPRPKTEELPAGHGYPEAPVNAGNADAGDWKDGLEDFEEEDDDTDSGNDSEDDEPPGLDNDGAGPAVANVNIGDELVEAGNPVAPEVFEIPVDVHQPVGVDKGVGDGIIADLCIDGMEDGVPTKRLRLSTYRSDFTQAQYEAHQAHNLLVFAHEQAEDRRRIDKIHDYDVQLAGGAEVLYRESQLRHLFGKAPKAYALADAAVQPRKDGES